MAKRCSSRIGRTIILSRLDKVKLLLPNVEMLQKNPNTEERRNNCCTVTESKTFSKIAFNRLRNGNGHVVFKMEFTDKVDVETCRTNRGTITFTPPEIGAPTPAVSLFLFF